MTPHRSRFFCSRLLGAAFCVALAGCSGQAPPTGKTPATPAAAAPTLAQARQLAGVSAIDLRRRAQLALREQRMFAPAGENAIEFYVALRGRSATPDADAQGALMELQPYAVIGAEQALARGDFDEAERLRRLVAAIDPAAPSLGRIADAIKAKVGAQAQAELAQELVPVRTPQPEYPTSTRRNGETGQVVASFTVLSDGSIGAIGVESVGARQLAFERSVLAAVKRWKYKPPGEERNVRMNFAFAP